MDFYNMAQTKYNKVNQMNYYIHKGGAYADKMYDITVTPEKLYSFELNYHGDIYKGMFSINANAFYNKYTNSIDFVPVIEWTSDKYLEDNTYQGDFTNNGLSQMPKDVLAEFCKNYIGSKYYTKKGQYTSYGTYMNNANDIKIVGGELIAAIYPHANIIGEVSYGFAHNLDRALSHTTQYAPHLIKAKYQQYFLKNKLMYGTQLLYEPKLKKSSDTESAYNEIYFTDRTILDLSLRYAPTNNIAVQFSAYNVLGECRPAITYKPDPKNNYPQHTNLGDDVRTFTISLKYKI